MGNDKGNSWKVSKTQAEEILRQLQPRSDLKRLLGLPVNEGIWKITESAGSATRELMALIGPQDLCFLYAHCRFWDSIWKNLIEKHVGYSEKGPKKQLKAVIDALNGLKTERWLEQGSLSRIIQNVKVEMLRTKQGARYIMALCARDVLYTGGRKLNPRRIEFDLFIARLVASVVIRNGQFPYRLFEAIATFLTEQNLVGPEGITGEAIRKIFQRTRASLGKLLEIHRIFLSVAYQVAGPHISSRIPPAKNFHPFLLHLLDPSTGAVGRK